MSPSTSRGQFNRTFTLVSNKLCPCNYMLSTNIVRSLYWVLLNSFFKTLMCSFLCLHVKARAQPVNYKRSVISNWPLAYDNRKNICLLGMRKLSPQVCIYIFIIFYFYFLHSYMFCFVFLFLFFFRLTYTIYGVDYAVRKAMFRAT